MSKSVCEACTVCCHVLPHVELRKPTFTDCPNADPGGVGCKVYDNRPGECGSPKDERLGFLCAWARGDIDRKLKPSDIGGYIGSLYGDRITVYGVTKAPQELIDIALAQAEKNPRSEVHVHTPDGIVAYRDGEVVAKSELRLIPAFEVKT